VKSLRQELLNDGNVVEQRQWGQTAFLQQVASKLGDDPRLGSLRDWWPMRFHNAYLAKYGEESRQRCRVASANPLLPTAMAQESIHDLVVQMLDSNPFLLQPTAEIGDYDNLLSDRVVTVALFGYCGRIGVEVFTQRPVA